MEVAPGKPYDIKVHEEVDDLLTFNGPEMKHNLEG